MRHPWGGAANCEAADNYYASVEKRENESAARLISLTGWDKSEVEALMGATLNIPENDEKWWRKLWKQ